MKKMTVGDSIGQFLIEEVIRPLIDGNALVKVRYEGSYVRGYLCAVDVRQYGTGYDIDEKLLHELRALCKEFMALGRETENMKAGAFAFLPDRIFSCASTDGAAMVLGYFKCDNWCCKSVETKMTLADLGNIAKVLDAWHKNGIAHGSLHPRGVRKADDGSGYIFSCPIFPVVLHDSEIAWTYTFGVKNVDKDRKAFFQMVADVLNGDNDSKGFSKRLISSETNVAAIPLISSFLCDTSVTCEQLVKNAAEDKKTKDRAKEIRKSRNFRNKCLVWLISVAAVCLILLGVAFHIKDVRDVDQLRIKVNTTLAEARAAKDIKEWKKCRDKVQAILAMQPTHKGALSLKEEAERCINVNKLLVYAIAATNSFKWQDCKDRAAEILNDEPENIEAQNLKKTAESKIQALSNAIASARDAKNKKEWQLCSEKASEALSVAPSDEAQGLKADAESMIKLRLLLVEAREAQDNKKWLLCLQKANEALVIVDKDTDALKLKTNAESRIQSLSNALASAREAKNKKEWQVCSEKASEALSVAPSDEAQGLKADAERGMKLSMALAALEAAKKRKEFQFCIEKANEALSVEPGHLEAKKSKSDAERMIRLFAALTSARDAKVASQWALCAEMANTATGIEDEPEHSEALILKSDAERKLKLITVLVAAREAKVAEKWQVCEVKASEILVLEPDHAEALELKAYAKSRLQTLVEKLVASARKAKENREWQVCLDKVNEIFLFESNNLEAKALKEEADRRIRISSLLSEGRNFLSRKDWQFCVNKCSEVLVLDAGNVEATSLMKEAYLHLGTFARFNVYYGSVGVVAKFWDGVTVMNSSDLLTLRKNSKYFFTFWSKASRDSNGNVSARVGSIEFQSTWDGLKVTSVILTENEEAAEGVVNDILRRKGVPPDQW